MKYYVLSRHKKNKMLVHESDDKTADAVMEEGPIHPLFTARFFIDDKVVFKPKPYDFHIAPPYPVISTKIKEILEFYCVIHKQKVQFVKATISYKDQVWEDYWFLHVMFWLTCLDRDKSIYKTLDDDEMITRFKKLVLDESRIKPKYGNPPFIFRLEEKPGIYLFHKKFVDAVMRGKPTGIKFYPVEEWHTFINQ